jgi:hypothetical protein
MREIMKFIRKTFAGHRTGGWVSALLVLSLCTCFVLPLPGNLSTTSPPGAGKDASSPFPCLFRTCGCLSANDCWKKCCCFSNAQKVAWAKKNNVQVPDFVSEAAVVEQKKQAAISSQPGQQTPPFLAETPQRTVASQLLNAILDEVIDFLHEDNSAANQVEPTIAFTAESPSLPESSAVCKSRDKCCDATDDDACEKPQPSAKTQSPWKWVSFVKSLECSGMNLVHLVLSTALVPQTPSLPEFPTAPLTTQWPVSERLPDSVAQSPTPPPRLPAG